MKHRLTREERQLIRGCAQKASGHGRVRLEASVRISNKTGETSLNAWLLTSDPQRNDLDHYDHNSWNQVCSGFTLTHDGRAVIDIWIYSLGRDGELETQIQAFWERGKLVRIQENGTPMWDATKEAA